MSLRWWLSAGWALLRRPDLWVTAARQLWVLAAPGWWRRAPYLPLPDTGYLRFRLVTAYGGTGDAEPTPADLLTYLHWCRSWPHVARR